MGDEFPEAEIQAIDLSPIQPSSVPQNVHFFIDDASEEDWAVPSDYFDYIHTRVLLGCFADFQEVIKKGFYYTKPGGHMESQEIMSTPYCDDGTMPEDWPFLEWTKYNDDAAVAADRPLRIADKLKWWYQEAGFMDVEEKVFKLPMNPWPRDKHLKTLGRISEDNWLAGIAGFSMAPFSRILNWSKVEIEVRLDYLRLVCLADEFSQVYLVNVRKAISDRNVYAYHKVFVIWGRKPLDAEMQSKATAQPSSKRPPA